MLRRMQSTFLRKSRKLTALTTLLCCLLFIYVLRFYQDDLSKKSYGGEFTGEFDGRVTCEGFTSNQVLITTPNKILLYDLKSGFSRLIHNGDGLYYNSFKGPNAKDPHSGKCVPTLFVNTRKYYEKGKEMIPDKVLKIDMSSGRVLQTYIMSYSFFTHDMIKYNDNMFLADTGHGLVWNIEVPSFEPKEKLAMFKKEDHVNNLALHKDILFVMMHSRGVSGLAVVDLKTKETVVLRGVGNQAHQIVLIQNKQILYLDSGLPGLKVLDLANLKVYTLFEAKGEPKRFLKGLFVKDNVAYIGSTVAGSRQWRRDIENDAQIIAFDLKTLNVISEKKIESDGILNTISQPFFREDSGFVASNTDFILVTDNMEVTPGLKVEYRQNAEDGTHGALISRLKNGLGPATSKGSMIEAAEPVKQVEDTVKVKESAVLGIGDVGGAGGPKRQVIVYDKTGKDHSEVTPENLVGGEWPSGMKFIDLMWKNMDKKADLTSKVDRAEDVQLIMGNCDGKHLMLREMLVNLPVDQWEYKNQLGNAFLSERDGVMNKFKPGVRDIKFVFSDINAETSYWFPWYFKFESVLRPIIDKVLGPNMTHHIARMQLARMADAAEIKPHVDSGGWPSKLHRIHVPIIVPQGTVFSVVGKDGTQNSYSIRLVEGEVFEINNRVLHWVKNPSNQRIHLLIDARERPYDPLYLAPGQTCKYMRNIICEEPTVTREKSYQLYQEAIKN